MLEIFYEIRKKGNNSSSGGGVISVTNNTVLRSLIPELEKRNPNLLKNIDHVAYEMMQGDVLLGTWAMTNDLLEQKDNRGILPLIVIVPPQPHHVFHNKFGVNFADYSIFSDVTGKRIKLFLPPMSVSSNNEAKLNVKYSEHECWNTCLFCGRNKDEVTVTKAHILAGGPNKEDYTTFGPPDYQNDFDPTSPRNFLPLCGSVGQKDTCYDLFNTYQLTLLWNPFESYYYLHISDRVSSNVVDRMKSTLDFPNHDFHPYKRLLACRAMLSVYHSGCFEDKLKSKLLVPIDTLSMSSESVESSSPVCSAYAISEDDSDPNIDEQVNGEGNCNSGILGKRVLALSDNNMEDSVRFYEANMTQKIYE